MSQVMENEVGLMEVTQNNSLSKLGEFEVRLRDLAGKYKGLTVAGIDDKDGYDTMSAARKELKSARVEVEKYAKALRDPATKFNKSVSEREKQLVGIVSPLEDAFEKRTDEIADELDMIRKKEEQAEMDRINDRIKKLSEYNYALDFSIISKMDDTQFGSALAEAKRDWDKEQEKIRLEKEAEENRRKIYDARIEKLFSLGFQYNGHLYVLGLFKVNPVDIELSEELWAAKLKECEGTSNAHKEQLVKEELERAEQAEKDRLFREEQYRIQQENEKKRLELEDQKRKLDEEKAAVEEQKRKDEAIKAAEERAKVETEQRLKREEEERKAQEERDKIEKLRQESLSPDKDKLIAFTNILNAITFPEVSSVEATEVIEYAKKELSGLSSSIYQRAHEL